MKDVTYNVYRDGVKIASGIKDTVYTDTGLEPNTTYTYQVSAENEYGESELSEPVAVTTEESPADNEDEEDSPEESE